MKKHFVDGKEITEAEAQKIERENAELMASPDVNDWLRIKFIVTI